MSFELRQGTLASDSARSEMSRKNAPLVPGRGSDDGLTGVFINIDGHVNLNLAARRGWKANELEFGQEAVLVRLPVLTLEEPDHERGLPVPLRRKPKR